MKITPTAQEDDMRPPTVEGAAANNAAIIDERGPGLYYDMSIYVVARRPSTGEVLLGGLGALGVGRMWMTDSDDYQRYPGYAEAEIVD